MTDDRASLGARLAEAMGWEGSSSDGIWNPPGEAWLGVFWHSEDLVTWEGYGIVDAWMREQGYSKSVYTVPGYPDCYVDVSYGKPDICQFAFNNDGDEPLAAIQAALKALEARE